MVPVCPRSIIGEGPPGISCERYYLKACMLGKRRKRIPLQSESHTVSGWVRFLAGGETPARVSGARGPGFHYDSATLCHETAELKTALELSWPNQLIPQMQPRGGRNLSRGTKLVDKVELYRVSKFSLAPGVWGLSMGAATGHSGSEHGCEGRVWQSSVLTQVGGSFSSILTWAFRFLYTNSISFSASLPQINTTGQVSPRGCCSCRRESAHKGRYVLTCPSPDDFISLHPAPSSDTPMSLGTCSAAARSSVMSKRTALAPRSPAIRACRDTWQRSGCGQRSTRPIRPSVPCPFLGRCVHLHLCTFIYNMGEGSVGRGSMSCSQLPQDPLPSKTTFLPSFRNGINP